jgi:peptidoglycan/LPS O-acetylase OafA/YrhL
MCMTTSEPAGGQEVAPRDLSRPPRQDVPALTGLRFVAAFSVLLGHGFAWMLQSHETPGGLIYWVSEASGFGMTLFFVLSGFVIHYNYAALVTQRRLRGVVTYLWARFARLYPLFLLMMLVYVLVGSRTLDLLTGHPERFVSTVQALPYFLLSIHSWVYRIIDGNSLIGAIGGGSPMTWSISTEWFFYFAYPCIAWLLLRPRTPRLTLILGLLWCILWISIASGLYDRSPQIDAWAIQHFGPDAGMQEHEQHSFVRWLLYYSPYLRIGEFVLGTFMAQLHVQLRDRQVTELENSIGTAVFLAAAASAILITYLEYGPDVGENIFRKMNMNFALAPAAALLIFCGARYDSAASRLLTSRPAIGLGEASYSIYLVHPVVLVTAVKLTGSAVHGIVYDLVKLLFLIAAILLISLILYACYEAPARKWLRARGGGRPSPVALAEAPQSSAF